MTLLEIIYLGWILNILATIASIIILVICMLTVAARDLVEFHKFKLWIEEREHRAKPWKSWIYLFIPYAQFYHTLYFYYLLVTAGLPFFEFLKQFISNHHKD